MIETIEAYTTIFRPFGGPFLVLIAIGLVVGFIAFVLIEVRR